MPACWWSANHPATATAFCLSPLTLLSQIQNRNLPSNLNTLQPAVAARPESPSDNVAEARSEPEREAARGLALRIEDGSEWVRIFYNAPIRRHLFSHKPGAAWRIVAPAGWAESAQGGFVSQNTPKKGREKGTDFPPVCIISFRINEMSSNAQFSPGSRPQWVRFVIRSPCGATS